MAPRQCIDLPSLGALDCYTDAVLCMCGERLDRLCTSSTQCLSGDRCLRLRVSGIQFCFSCALAPLIVETHEIVDTQSSCVRDDSALGPATGERPGGTESDEDAGGNNSAGGGEESGDGGSAPGGPGNGGNGDVCVAARQLRHLPRSALLYARHRLATVLCDAHGSCATPGHIIVHAGVAQTMATYCRLRLPMPARATAGEAGRVDGGGGGGCERRVMWVNSLKMRAQLRVPSDSPDMQFTAFAARFGTPVEEAILAMLLRFFF